MASKIEYWVVRVEMTNPDKGEITDEDSKKIMSQVDYEFKDLGKYIIDTEIYCKIAPDQL